MTDRDAVDLLAGHVARLFSENAALLERIAILESRLRVGEERASVLETRVHELQIAVLEPLPVPVENKALSRPSVRDIMNARLYGAYLQGRRAS